ncbi:MAG: HAMP domain-containing histidine kinase [Ruminococcaceae bacterium]|nr:HAMP domain-containing histidine kinase [Oscillospiraceae bacterium]
MLLTAFVALFIILTYIAINFKSKLTYVVGLYIFSIISMMIVVVLYTTKISTYKFPLELDYSIYLFLTKNFKLTNAMVARLLNFSFALFFISSVSYVKVIGKLKMYIALIFVMPIVCFYIVNDPYITKKVFFLANSFNNETAALYTNVQLVIKRFNTFIFVAYAIFPVYYIVKSYISLKLTREKRDLLISVFIISLIFICVYAIFVLGPYKFIMMNNVNFMKIPVHIPPDISYVSVPMLILFILIVVLVIILFCKPFDNFSFINKLELANGSKWLDKNVNMILHIYKNAFWGINQYLKFAQDNIEDVEKAKNNIAKGRAIAEEHIEMLINMQSKLDNFRSKVSCFNIDDCITNALAKTGLPTEKVGVVFENYNKNIEIFGDFEHLSEAFVNLFLNSVQAIEKSKKEESYVTISAHTDQSYILISVQDNGCGIEDEDIKEVFKPFFSKKLRNNSGGIGLYYVDNVIKNHYGEISVKSKVNEYTRFDIVLPATKK